MNRTLIKYAALLVVYHNYIVVGTSVNHNIGNKENRRTD